MITTTIEEPQEDNSPVMIGNTTLQERICTLLQITRENKGYKQSVVAQMLGITQQQVSMYEKSIPGFEAIVRFCMIYQIVPSSFFAVAFDPNVACDSKAFLLLKSAEVSYDVVKKGTVTISQLPLATRLGQLFRAVERDIEMKQSTIAEKMNVTPQHLSHLESTATDQVQLIVRFCVACNVDPQRFFNLFFDSAIPDFERPVFHLLNDYLSKQEETQKGAYIFPSNFFDMMKDSTIFSRIGPLLRKIRLDKRLKQTDVSRMVHYTQQAVAWHETKNQAHTFDTILRYCQLYKIEPVAFIAVLLNKDIDLTQPVLPLLERVKVVVI